MEFISDYIVPIGPEGLHIIQILRPRPQRLDRIAAAEASEKSCLSYS